MQKRIFSLVFSLFLFGIGFAQESKQDSLVKKAEVPTITYSANPKEYEIAAITTSGASNYEDAVLIGFSGLEVGKKVKVPGDEITAAIKRFWKQGLFADVKITATKIEGNKVWLNIALTQRPRISQINFKGLKKSQKEDIEVKINLVKGNQITPNLVNRTKEIIKKYFEEKGYLNAQVDIIQKEDIANPGNVIVDVVVDKNAKVKIKEVQIEGNKAMSYNKASWTMKKTNQVGRWQTFFRTKKYIKENYEADKIALINKYNEMGYRDAIIVKDTVFPVSKNRVKVYIKVDEGNKYYFRNISWVGNTLYSSDFLQQVLRLKKGDVYNQKLLSDRLSGDDDAVSNLYLDNGYLFFHVEPVEAQIVGDSVDVEMHIYEGTQAVINEVGIKGNTRVYEHVIRRELRTKPGQLFSKTDLQRTVREIAQMGHFDPEKLNPDIQPNAENGTVDITYPLETKGSDQVELSAGYGSTGIIGTVSLKFTNFSIRNLFNPESYKIVPQGDGETLTLRAQTNASYYQSYGFSFLEPWLGGSRPNSLSISGSYSIQTGVSDRYYSSGAYSSSYYQSLYGLNTPTSSTVEYDNQKFIKTIGVAAGIGTRLNWPDDYFTLYGELSYQHYQLQDWQYFIMTNGHSNNLSFNITLGRNSINNPYYTSSGSSFAITLKVTPPYSLLGKSQDYQAMLKAQDYQDLYNWVEYHKWEMKSKTFTPLSKNDKLVLVSKIQCGFLGYYNEYKRSPFETFYMGGDGMTTSSNASYAIETIGMRGYANGSLTPIQTNLTPETQIGNLYEKLTFELRYPLVTGTTTVYALTFAEAGNCWYDFNQYSPFLLKRSAGIGIRIFLPMIGLMGVDWGYGFDQVNGNYDNSKSQFHFVIGQEF
jgi:outer membrane protein insertion porin family